MNVAMTTNAVVALMSDSQYLTDVASGKFLSALYEAASNVEHARVAIVEIAGFIRQDLTEIEERGNSWTPVSNHSDRLMEAIAKRDVNINNFKMLCLGRGWEVES